MDFVYSTCIRQYLKCQFPVFLLFSQQKDDSSCLVSTEIQGGGKKRNKGKWRGVWKNNQLSLPRPACAVAKKPNNPVRGKGPTKHLNNCAFMERAIWKCCLATFLFGGLGTVRMGCPAGPAAFRGLPLLGKPPEQMWKAMGQIIHWLLSEGFTGLPWFDGQVFGFCTLGKANSSLVSSLSSVLPVGQLWWGHDGWGASQLTLGFASPTSCRCKKQKFTAKPLCTSRTLPSGKETGIVFSSLDLFFFFSHKDTLCQISQKFGICTNRSDCILFLYITWKTSIFL